MRMGGTKEISARKWLGSVTRENKQTSRSGCHRRTAGETSDRNSRVAPPRSTAASTAGCTPPQPSQLAARGRPFSGDLFAWAAPASPPDSLSARFDARPGSACLDDSVAVAESASRFAVLNATAQSAVCLLREILQEQCVHRPLEAPRASSVIRISVRRSSETFQASGSRSLACHQPAGRRDDSHTPPARGLACLRRSR